LLVAVEFMDTGFFKPNSKEEGEREPSALNV
jgi:hypothetical protein